MAKKWFCRMSWCDTMAGMGKKIFVLTKHSFLQERIGIQKTLLQTEIPRDHVWYSLSSGVSLTAVNAKIVLGCPLQHITHSLRRRDRQHLFPSLLHAVCLLLRFHSLGSLAASCTFLINLEFLCRERKIAFLKVTPVSLPEVALLPQLPRKRND